MATLFTVFGKNFSWISQKQLPLGQKNVAVAERWPAVVERFKQESMHGEMDVSGGSTVLVFPDNFWAFLVTCTDFFLVANTFQFFPDYGDSVFVSFTPVKATLQSPWTWNAVKRIAYLGGCVFAVFMKLVHLMIHLF